MHEFDDRPRRGRSRLENRIELEVDPGMGRIRFLNEIIGFSNQLKRSISQW